MSLPVCPECKDKGPVRFAGKDVPCPACGGTGKDISDLTSAIAEALENHGLLGARIDAMASSVVLAVLAVLDKEGTLSVYPKEVEDE